MGRHAGKCAASLFSPVREDSSGDSGSGLDIDPL
jgi:hypothetical protein